MTRNASIGLLLLLTLLAGCSRNGREGGDSGPPTSSDGNAAPTTGTPTEEGASIVAFQLPERDLFPEGMAYDPVTGDFFVGSLRKSKIIRIAGSGAVDTLAVRAELGQGGILGMKVDPGRRVLWSNFHQSDEQLGADPSVPFRTGIHKIDLESGRLLRSYAVEKTDENHLFNDIALASDGTVYITSFSKGALYRIASDTGVLEEWLPMPEGVYTNGIDIEPTERFLFVAGSADIYRVEIETREVTRLELPEGELVGYTDGLYFDAGSLVNISSWQDDGELHYRVARLGLSEGLSSIESVRPLDQDHPLFAFPTTGVIVDGWFYYIATAQFDKVDERGTLAPWYEMSDIFILKVAVGE